MATVSVTIRMDEALKKQADMGLNMTTAITLFTKAVVREGKIPFEIAANPFYSSANQARLLDAVKQLNAGKGTAHELAEDDQ